MPAPGSPSYDPYDYALHEDPYPAYRRLRDEAPLYRDDALDFWALSRHADVSAAFRDHARCSSANGVSLDPSAWGPAAHRAMSFLAMDQPAHTRLRALVSNGFTPRRVRELEADILRLSRKHLDPALAAGGFDAVADFAGRLPMDVVSELMGVPEADRDEVRRLADLVVHREEGLNDIPPAGMEAALVLAGYYQDLVAARRRPGPDLTSALLAAEEGRDRMADRPHRHRGHRTARHARPGGRAAAAADRGGQPRRAGVPRARRLRPRPRHLAADQLRRRAALLPGGQSRPAGGEVALTEFARRVRAYDVDAARSVRVRSVNVRGFAALPITVTPR